MEHEPKQSTFRKVKTFVVGKAHNPLDPRLFHSLTLIALFAWIGLGADALSSSSYGPQEAFLALGSHTYLASFVALFTAFTIFIISASYSQVIEVFPGGGGGYLAASKLLSPSLGMISGCALLIDYVLTIAISIASGADALFSFFPIEYQAFKIWFAIGAIVLLILLNMRGVRESVIPLIPIFLLFVITHVFIILYAIFTHFTGLPALAAKTTLDFQTATLELGFVSVILLLLHAYSMGAGTYTGIEAVSNGMTTLREPRVKTAKKTMRYMSISLAVLVIGLMVSYLLYGLTLQPGKTLNATLFETATQGWGGFGYYFVLAALFSEALLLIVAAQTGFLGGPRILSNMALDKWLPMSFATLSDRLVTEKGILIMGGAALATILLTGGSVKFLVILYSITVFITFFLTQLGMVKYWLNNKSRIKVWKRKLFINGTALVLTSIILVSVTILKFDEGGWITLLVTLGLVGIVALIKRHYTTVQHKMKKLDILVMAASSPHSKCFFQICKNRAVAGYDPKAKTAVVFVSGFNGIGLQALSTIFKYFGDTFKNFIFVHVGVIDAGVFKGAAEMRNLNRQVKIEAEKYVTFMENHGYYAESLTGIDNDLVYKLEQMSAKVRKRFPNSVFFGGQIILQNDNMFSKMLHNFTVLAKISIHVRL